MIEKDDSDSDTVNSLPTSSNRKLRLNMKRSISVSGQPSQSVVIPNDTVDIDGEMRRTVGEGGRKQSLQHQVTSARSRGSTPGRRQSIANIIGSAVKTIRTSNKTVLPPTYSDDDDEEDDVMDGVTIDDRARPSTPADTALLSAIKCKDKGGNSPSQARPKVASEGSKIPLSQTDTSRARSLGIKSPSSDESRKTSRRDFYSSAPAVKPAPQVDISDLNIKWRMEARKAVGQKTTPAKMQKLRSMLKHEANGSRRRRNSCYSIDPSLLERPGRIQELHSMEEFQSALKSASDSLVCVTYSAKWCGPWRMIKPDVHRLSHIHGDVIFYEIDVDENEEIALERRVACMPTFQFFKCGIMLDKFAEPNRIKLDETIRKLRKMEMKPEL